MNRHMLDDNNIWVTPHSEFVSYPSNGHSEFKEIENNSFWFQHRNNVIYSVMNRFSYHNNFVDIGGGNGYQSAFIASKYPGKKVFLNEPGYEGCLNAKRRGLDHVYNMSFYDFPFVENEIGGVGLFDVIEHIDNDGKFLSDLVNMLSTGTMIYMTVPAFELLWSEADDYAGHFRRYTLGSLRKLTASCGVKIIYSSYFFFYLPPLSFFIRSMPYRFGKRHGLEKIIEHEKKQHELSRFTGYILSQLNQFEIKLIERFKVPVGGSCIMVLKKL